MQNTGNELEPEVVPASVSIPPAPKTWRDKIFNSCIPITAVFLGTVILNLTSERSTLSKSGFVIFTLAGLISAIGYLESAGFLDGARAMALKRKLSEKLARGVEATAIFLGKTVKFLVKAIGWGITIAFFGTIAYLFFGAAGSLSVTTLLTIIIVILVLK